MTSYKCINCSYNCKLFNDMVKHLSRVTMCPKSLEGYKYTDEEIIKISLLPHKKDKKIDNLGLLKKKTNMIKISKEKYFNVFNQIEKNKLRICPLCNSKYDKKCELKKHIILECATIDFENDNINTNLPLLVETSIKNNNEKVSIFSDDNISNVNTNINHNANVESLMCGKENTINNITNNSYNIDNINNNYNIDNINIINNININSPVSFDDEWDVSHLSHEEKTLLIISMYKYTKTLEKLLKNKKNLNVVVDQKSNSGLVYKKNSIEVMSLNEICDKSLDKLNHHLNTFFDDVTNNNNYHIDKDYLKHEKKVLRIKHGNYKYYEKDRLEANNAIIKEYNGVKNQTLEKFNAIKDYEDKNF